MRKSLYIATGAYDCGKTTTLNYLQTYYGYNIHREAPLITLAILGDKTKGHESQKTFQKIKNKNHFCPMCNPLEFTQLVLDKQLEIESKASEGAVLERGYIDTIEYFLRNTNSSSFPLNYSKQKFADYSLVFLFELIPEIQVPKWGKTKEQRILEAQSINGRLLDMYLKEGFNVYLIGRDSVEKRAEKIHSLISNRQH